MSKSSRKYYAADNSYGTSTSLGFANTWFVYVFDSTASRDKWVADTDNLSRRSITRREAVGYASNWSTTRNEPYAPRPFTGEYWGIDTDTWAIRDDVPGLIGELTVCHPSDRADRFY